MQPCVSTPIIGYHRSPLSQKFGIPRQPNLAQVPSHIEMIAPYHIADAFEGIEIFSHLWITWQAHHNRPPDTFKAKVRLPRLGGNASLGVFATRSTYRPSQLGLSVVQLDSIRLTKSGVAVHIIGADMVDGTPIIDVKPYLNYSDSIQDAVSGFATGAPIHKPVDISATAYQQFSDILANNKVANGIENNNGAAFKLNQRCSQGYVQILIEKDLEIISSLIAQDPRPAYRQSDMERIFFMRYKDVDVGFRMSVDYILWIETITQVR